MRESWESESCPLLHKGTFEQGSTMWWCSSLHNQHVKVLLGDCWDKLKEQYAQMERAVCYCIACNIGEGRTKGKKSAFTNCVSACPALEKWRQCGGNWASFNTAEQTSSWVLEGVRDWLELLGFMCSMMYQKPLGSTAHIPKSLPTTDFRPWC